MDTCALSIIIPAYNEADRLPGTLKAIRNIRRAAEQACGGRVELIVVDDGSTDETAQLAYADADLILQLSRNGGKGAALHAGYLASSGRIAVFLDADLEESAQHFMQLVEPILRNEADLSVAKLPAASRKAGLGLVKTLAARGVLRLSGFKARAPLSGQRAVRREVLERTGRWFEGFGAEVGMLIDIVKLGYRVAELDVDFRHRETGRDLEGWQHRGRQFIAVGRALWMCWRRPVC